MEEVSKDLWVISPEKECGEHGLALPHETSVITKILHQHQRNNTANSVLVHLGGSCIPTQTLGCRHDNDISNPDHNETGSRSPCMRPRSDPLK